MAFQFLVGVSFFTSQHTSFPQVTLDSLLLNGSKVDTIVSYDTPEMIYFQNILHDEIVLKCTAVYSIKWVLGLEEYTIFYDNIQNIRITTERKTAIDKNIHLNSTFTSFLHIKFCSTSDFALFYLYEESIGCQSTEYSSNVTWLETGGDLNTFNSRYKGRNAIRIFRGPKIKWRTNKPGKNKNCLYNLIIDKQNSQLGCKWKNESVQRISIRNALNLNEMDALVTLNTKCKNIIMFQRCAENCLPMDTNESAAVVYCGYGEDSLSIPIFKINSTFYFDSYEAQQNSGLRIVVPATTSILKNTTYEFLCTATHSLYIKGFFWALNDDGVGNASIYLGNGVDIIDKNNQVISKKSIIFPDVGFYTVICFAPYYWSVNNDSWSDVSTKVNVTFQGRQSDRELDLESNGVPNNYSHQMGKDVSLKVLTWILIPISFACLVLSLSSLLLEKQGRSTEKKMTIHLSIILISGNVLLLLGDKDNFHLSDPICTTFAILNHFAWLSTFCWMALEGVDLYIQVIKRIIPTTNKFLKIYYAIGYGIPILVVVVNYAIGHISQEENIHVGKMVCWLQDNYIWGFGAPAVIMALVNLICAWRTSYGIATMTSAENVFVLKGMTKVQTKASYTKRTLESVILTVMLGVAWISGVSTLVDSQISIIWHYMFMIFISSQGIFIYIFRCPFNKAIRRRVYLLLPEVISNYFEDSTKENHERFNEMKEIYSLLNGRTGRQPRESDVDEYTFNPSEYIFDAKYEIQKHSLIVDPTAMLGKGEFGEVYKGILRGVEGNVAVKSARPSHNTVYLKALVSEVKILMYIGPHENLVSLLGVYRREIKSGVFYAAMEFCELGSLQCFITKKKHLFLKCPILQSKVKSISLDNHVVVNRQLPDNFSFSCSINSLLKWSGQISNAMEYLGTKKVVHSDLATRNVLLNSNGNAKVTDFGLSRRTYNYSEYVKKAKDPLPWRWLAIESLLSNKFSCKSDVWAYGITLWEIFSLGRVPYPGMSPTAQFVERLEEGLRNTQPKYASDEIYSVMSLCWKLNPDNRPTFSSMKRIFEHAYENNLDNISNKVLEVENLEDVVIQLALVDYTEL